MMHLRPFLEVLLAGKIPPPPLPLPAPFIATPTPTSTSTPLSIPISIPIPPISSVGVGASTSASAPSPFLTTFPIQNPTTLSYLNLTVNENASQVQKLNGIMKGMYITINVRNVSLDLLRVPAADAVGTKLANAFSLQITDLRASIDIMDLVKADVKLRSFDIIDTRNISIDYVFKKVFCPVVNMDASVASWSSSASSNIDSLNKDKKGTVNGKEIDKDKDKKGKEIGKNEKKTNNITNNSTEQTSQETKSNTVSTEKKYADKEKDVLPDLLHVTYAQLSSLTSMLDVSVLNIASFVSTDTILDLSYVAMENFFSIMDLIASPSPSLSIALSVSPISPLPATQIPLPIPVPAQVFLNSDPFLPVLPSSPTPLPTTSVPSLSVPALTVPLHSSLIPSTTPDMNINTNMDINMNTNTNTSSYPTGVTYRNSAVSHHQSSSTLSLSSSDNPISPTSESLLFALSDDTSPLVCTSPPPITRPSNQHTPHPPHTAGPSSNTPQHATTEPHNQVLLQPDGTSTMMNVVVRVTNPRLILLEDPTTDESRAIVGSCDIEVHYSRENRYSAGISTITHLQNRELRESLHVSVHNHEVFVLRSMLAWNPQPIVEPMGMELNLRRRTVNSVLLSSSLSVDVDNLYARVSINDILLAQSIMTRRSLTEPSKASSSASASITSPSSSTAKSSLSNTSVRRVSGQKEQGALEGVEANTVRMTGTGIGAGAGAGVVGEEETPCPSYTYSLNMGSLSLVGINDFNGQNMPVIRALLDGTTFFAEGEHQKMIGKGSLIASTYFYNPRLSLWESIMDRWHPSLSLTSWALGWGVEIKSEHTMQLTVSGIMLQSLLQTFSLFFRSSDIVEREEISDVLIHNTLGFGIELDIYDSASGVLIMNLKGIDSKPVPRLQIPGKKRNFTGPIRNIPSVVDLHFRGGVERQPLHHIPFNINKPRAYNLHPCLGVVDTSVESCSVSGKRRSVPHTPPILIEPIEEEVFENCRYDLIIGRYGLCCVVLPMMYIFDTKESYYMTEYGIAPRLIA